MEQNPYRSKESAVDIAIRLRIGRLKGFDSRQEQEIFSSPKCAEKHLGPQCLSFWEYRGLFPIHKAAFE
jgi:hypothetical protein